KSNLRRNASRLPSALGWPSAPPLHGSSRMTPQPLLERLITRYPRYCNFMGYFTHKSQPVKRFRVTAVRYLIFGVRYGGPGTRQAAQRYYHVWNPGAGDGPAHRCSILSPGSRLGADRGIPEDGGRCLIFFLGMEACIEVFHSISRIFESAGSAGGSLVHRASCGGLACNSHDNSPPGVHLRAAADSQPPDNKQLPFAGQVGHGGCPYVLGQMAAARKSLRAGGPDNDVGDQSRGPYKCRSSRPAE